MSDDVVIPSEPHPADPRRAAWEQYRDECFIRSGIAPVWVWAAVHEFDFCTAVLYLSGIAGAALNMGSRAMALTVFEQHHIVPIVHLSAASLPHLQTIAEGDLAETQTRLRASQLAAEQALRDTLHRRHLFKAAPGSTDGAIQ